jgi:hypothetical protein
VVDVDCSRRSLKLVAQHAPFAAVYHCVLVEVVHRASAMMLALSIAGCLEKPNPVWGYEDTDAVVPGKGDDPSAGSDTAASTTSAGSTSDGASSGAGGTDGDGTDSAGFGAGGSAFYPCDGNELALEWFQSLPLPAGVWDEFTGNAATPSVQDGQLHVAVDYTDASTQDAYWYSTTVDPVPSSGVAGLELVSIPPAGTDAEIMLGLLGNGWFLYFELLDDELLTMVLAPNPMGGYTVRERTPFDPVEHRWIRLVFDAPSSTLVFQTSPDADTWQDFDTMTVDMVDFASMHLRFGSGAWSTPMVEDPLAVIDNVFICPN